MEQVNVVKILYLFIGEIIPPINKNENKMKNKYPNEEYFDGMVWFQNSESNYLNPIEILEDLTYTSEKNPNIFENLPFLNKQFNSIQKLFIQEFPNENPTKFNSNYVNWLESTLYKSLIFINEKGEKR